MSRISVPGINQATGTAAEVFARIRKAAGSVPNTYAALGALSPDALKAMLAADAVSAAGSLSRKDRETINLIVSEVVGCDYCANAHSYLGKLAGLSVETLHQLRLGKPTGDAKRDALARFVRVLAQDRGTVPRAEFDAIKAAGYTDAQLAEISLAFAVITFTNVFNRLNDTTIDFPAAA